MRFEEDVVSSGEDCVAREVALLLESANMIPEPLTGWVSRRWLLRIVLSTLPNTSPARIPTKSCSPLYRLQALRTGRNSVCAIGSWLAVSLQVGETYLYSRGRRLVQSNQLLYTPRISLRIWKGWMISATQRRDSCRRGCREFLSPNPFYVLVTAPLSRHCLPLSLPPPFLITAPLLITASLSRILHRKSTAPYPSQLMTTLAKFVSFFSSAAILMSATSSRESAIIFYSYENTRER